MEMKKSEKTQAPIQLITKILLPCSVISIVLSYPYLQILAFGLQQYLSFSIHKNYMFLLCNGLLVFIATSSGLISISSVETESKAEKSIKSKGSSSQREQLESKGSIAKVKVKQVAAEVDQETQDSKTESNLALSQETEAVAMVAEDDKEQEHRNEAVVVVEEDEDEDEDEAFGSMSNEELNRKCEDFIRKMKEGIKFEHRQLIMVH